MTATLSLQGERIIALVLEAVQPNYKISPVELYERFCKDYPGKPKSQEGQVDHRRQWMGAYSNVLNYIVMGNALDPPMTYPQGYTIAVPQSNRHRVTGDYISHDYSLGVKEEPMAIPLATLADPRVEPMVALGIITVGDVWPHEEESMHCTVKLITKSAPERRRFLMRTPVMGQVLRHAQVAGVIRDPTAMVIPMWSHPTVNSQFTRRGIKPLGWDHNHQKWWSPTAV